MVLHPLHGAFLRAELLAGTAAHQPDALPSNALPNVAGMGSIETAFLLVFSSFMTSGEAMSTLMLFRIASYYFVFAASAAGTFAAQKHLENS